MSDDLRRATDLLGLQPVNDLEPLRNGVVQRDEYSFVLADVPVLSIRFGYALGTDAHHLIKSWRATRYPSALDNCEQPIDVKAVADFARLHEALIKAVANREARPQWRTIGAFRPRTPAPNSAASVS